MANNPSVEDVARAIAPELYAIKAALAEANDKLQSAFGDGFEVLGADVLYNDPNNACDLMEIPLLLDHIQLVPHEVETQNFMPQAENEVGLKTTTTTVLAASCVPQCGTPYPKSPGDAGCCDQDMAWKRGRRGYYCCTATGCQLPST